MIYEPLTQVLRKFEQRYWLSSRQFYGLYAEGRLVNGEHNEDFSEWAGFYKLKREAALEQLSEKRLDVLRQQADSNLFELTPAEPSLEIA